MNVNVKTKIPFAAIQYDKHTGQQPEGPFTLSVSVNASMSLTISL